MIIVRGSNDITEEIFEITSDMYPMMHDMSDTELILFTAEVLNDQAIHVNKIEVIAI